MQTESYARCLIRAAHPSGDEGAIERQIKVRMERQVILARHDPPNVAAVMDEGVLRRVVGGLSIHREQLRHLVRLGRRDNVSLRVIPFEAGEHMGREGQFTLFEFPDRKDASVAYQEGLFGDVYVEDADDLARYTLAAEQSRGAALDETTSVAFIENLAKETS